jgi:hypothetical protein
MLASHNYPTAAAAAAATGTAVSGNGGVAANYQRLHKTRFSQQQQQQQYQQQHPPLIPLPLAFVSASAKETRKKNKQSALVVAADEDGSGGGSSSIYSLSVATATNANDDSGISFNRRLSESAVRERFSIFFRYRIPIWNISIPALLMHIIELVVVLFLSLSIIDYVVPPSLGLWVPIVILCVGALYLLLFAVAIATAPKVGDAQVVPGLWLRLARYQQNDISHFKIGWLLYLVVGVFYMIWWAGPANRTLPVDPFADPTVFNSQQYLHLMLLLGNIWLLGWASSRNNIDSVYLALAASSQKFAYSSSDATSSQLED